jgi:hypothetical protein
MKIAKSTLATALAALMSLGVAGQASAYTSAGSVIEYTNLSITISDTNTVNNFNFVTTNTTTLNGTSIVDSDQCGGVPSFPTSLDNCAAGPVLDSDLQLLGTSGHTENNFTLDGPNAGTQYSYSDSVVYTSELTPTPGLNTTDASLIAETELLTSGGGNSSSTIQSTTGFTFTFTVTGTGSLTVSFNADPDMYAESDNPGSIVTLAEASIASTLTLSQDTGGTGNAEWSPDGDATNGCSDLAGGVTCSGEADPNSLNNKVAITTDGASDLYNPANGLYTISIDNLTPGDWSFSLTTTVANSVTKIQAVPEPTTLLLLGAGLAGLGISRRRSRKA